jgi:hypothetical protein
MEYKIAFAKSVVELVKIVNDEIKAGFEPIGTHVVTLIHNPAGKSDISYTQGLLKK